MADIERYLKLITSEHSIKPKYIATVTAVLESVDIDVDIDAAFDIDNALGKQLDILGIILGLNRTLAFQPTDDSSPVLNDDNYRDLLKAKIILNQWDGCMETLADALTAWSPSVYFTVKDNQDMSISVIAVGTNQLQKDLISNGYIIPKPAGVQIKYTMSDVPVFAYGTNSDTLKGYGAGTWV
jgi:Protein of unknown function (DUF2612).